MRVSGMEGRRVGRSEGEWDGVRDGVRVSGME